VREDNTSKGMNVSEGNIIQLDKVQYMIVGYTS